MNKTILVTIHMLIGIIAFGQENINENRTLRNTIFVEALGNGLFGSINYERQLTKEPGLSVRAGIGFYTEYDWSRILESEISVGRYSFIGNLIKADS